MSCLCHFVPDYLSFTRCSLCYYRLFLLVVIQVKALIVVVRGGGDEMVARSLSLEAVMGSGAWL